MWVYGGWVLLDVGNAGQCGHAIPSDVTGQVPCWGLQRETPRGSSGREGINKGICTLLKGPAGKAAALAAEGPPPGWGC